LTGTKINPDDCLALKLVDTKIKSESLNHLIEALVETTFDKDAFQSVDAVIQSFQQPAEESSFLLQMKKRHNDFSHHTIENIIQKLEQSSDDFSQQVLKTITLKSPTSLKVTLEALRRGKQLDFDACMQQEQILMLNFLKNHDFMEGIRALIIDKDQSPQWKPNQLKFVSQAMVDSYFLS